MDSVSVPCLVEKAVNMLTAMGCSRPKTSKKLENALRPCTMVVPYVNPLEVLEVAVMRSTYPDPAVINVQYHKENVYFTPSGDDTAFGESVAQHAHQTGRDYELVLPRSCTEREIMQCVLAWLGESEGREGTKEELVQELYSRCQKVVDCTVLEAVLKLQSSGFLKVQGDSVIYTLPTFNDGQTRCLEDVRHREKSFSGMVKLVRYHCGETNDDEDGGDYDREGSKMDLLLELVYWNWADVYYRRSSFGNIERWNGECEHKHGLSSGDVSPTATHKCTACVDGLEDVLRNILIAHSLSRMPLHERPTKLDELLALVRPQRLIYAVTPSHVLHQNLRQIKHRRRNRVLAKNGRKSKGKGQIEFAIGVAPGEIEAREVIPLTPRGLLGIDFQVTKTPPEGSSSSPRESERDTSMDSTPIWNSRNNPRAVGLSKTFAATLTKQVSVTTQRRNAVLIPATKREKEEAVSGVLEWIDSQYRSSGRGGEGYDAPNGGPKSIRQLQTELIGLCAFRPKRIAASEVVAHLLASGYVSVDCASNVSYHAVKPRREPGCGKALWQRLADEYRQAIGDCHSGYLDDAFPPRSPSKSGLMARVGKRKQVYRKASRKLNKRHKLFQI